MKLYDIYKDDAFQVEVKGIVVIHRYVGGLYERIHRIIKT